MVRDRALEQRRDALARAHEVRRRRARLRRDLRAGLVDVAAFVLSPPEWAASMRVFDLLTALPMCGKQRATRMLVACRVPATATLGGLTVRQRAELAERMPRPSARLATPVAA